MVAYIRDLAIRKHRWLSEDSFKHGVAICQVIPGATAMQVAAYVGLRSGGAFGAIAAYTGFGLPAFVFMVILAILYQNAHDQVTIVSIFRGLQLIIIALVGNAALNFGKGTNQEMACSALLSRFFSSCMAIHWWQYLSLLSLASLLIEKRQPHRIARLFGRH